MPFEGVFLQDMVFIEENPTNINGLINFEKMMLIANILKTVKQAQQYPYKFTQTAFVKAFLEKAVHFDENQLFELSKRATQTPGPSRKNTSDKDEKSEKSEKPKKSFLPLVT